MPQLGELEEESGSVQADEGGNSPKDGRRGKSDLRSAVTEVMRFQADPSFTEPGLGNLLGGAVNEEVAWALAKEIYPCDKKWESGIAMYASKPRFLELRFLDKISLPVLTGKQIKGEEDKVVRVALVDGLTGKCVTSGHEASAEVEILVIEADFNGDSGDNWTVEEFNSKIVTEGERQRSFLSGETHFNLREGIGFMMDVRFKHTKCWMTKRELRLGARIVDASLDTRIREAKSEPFIVEDCRNKLYQKHHPPSLDDPVWRLEKISREGASSKRLSKEKIDTVKDFLRLLNTKPQKLKDILFAGKSTKAWDVIVNHAQKCPLDKKAYLYKSPICLQNTIIVFNVVGQLIGQLKAQQYITVDDMSENEKADAHKLTESAFQHWEEVIPVDDESSLTSFPQQLPNTICPSNSATLGSPSDYNSLVASNMIHLHGNTWKGTLSAEFSSHGHTISSDGSGLFGAEKLDHISRQPLWFNGKISNSKISDLESVSQYLSDETTHFFSCNGTEELLHSESRSFQLYFLNDISLPVISGLPIKSEDCTGLKIALLDCQTGEVVISGPVSSATVEIIVIEVDSEGDTEFWTDEPSKKMTVKERLGKQTLLTGDKLLDLKEGIGVVGEIFLEEVSSLPKRCAVRLGARVVANDGVRVGEAKTKSFILEGHHRDSFKRQPPSLDDDVWHLEQIDKDGDFHKRLNSQNVNTVKDFLSLLSDDPVKLKNILGTNMSLETWEVIVDHAQTCAPDQKLYFYRCSGSVNKMGVVFNAAGKVKGLISDFQYIPINKFSETEKVDVPKLVKSAFDNWVDVVSIADEASLLNGSLCLPSLSDQTKSVTPDIYDGDKTLALNNTYSSANLQPHPTSSYSHDTVPSISPIWDLPSVQICDTESMIQAFSEDKLLQFSDNHGSLGSFNPILESHIDSKNVGDSVLLDHPVPVTKNKAQRRCLSRKNAQRRWKMLFSIMRWFSVRRNVVRRTPLKERDEDPNASLQDICNLCSIKSHNSNLESNADLYSTINNFMLAHSAAVAMNKASRRYITKRDKAQRRWRMLFSVMRWFSVKRNVARKTSVTEMATNSPTSSQDIMPYAHSTEVMGSFFDVNLLSSGYMDESPNISESVTESLIWDKCFHEEEHLLSLDTQFSEFSDQSQNSDKEWPASVQSATNEIPLPSGSVAVALNKNHGRYLVKRRKAQRRWKLLFSIARWFSVRRNLGRKSSIQQALFNPNGPYQVTNSSIPTMGNMNNGLGNNYLQNTDNTSYRQQQLMAGQVSDSVICDGEPMTQGCFGDEYLRKFDMFCSLKSQRSDLELQANLHNVVNDFLLARSSAAAMNRPLRRSNRNKAQRRWRMLFSVVRWFSVSRKVARQSHVIDMQRHF